MFRYTHICRFFGTTKESFKIGENGAWTGDVLPDMWADVERTDVWATSFKGNVQIRSMTWADNPDRVGNDNIGNPMHRYRIRKLFDPTTTPKDKWDDPDEFIPIPVIIATLREYKNQGSRQAQMVLQKNNNAIRRVRFRRFFHYDTSIDDAAQKALEDDPERKVYVVRGKNNPSEMDYPDYKRITKANGYDTDTKDEDQYIETAVVTAFAEFHTADKTDDVFNAQAVKDNPDVAGQVVVVALKQGLFLEMSEEAKLKELGPNDNNPPFVLDQWQQIININWGGLAVEFGDTDEDAPEPEK